MVCMTPKTLSHMTLSSTTSFVLLLHTSKLGRERKGVRKEGREGGREREGEREKERERRRERE